MIIAALTIAVYIILTLVRFDGIMFYYVSSILWGLLLLCIFKIPGHPELDYQIDKTIARTAVMIAGFQICALVFTGLFTGFGRSPYSFTLISILINIVYFLSGVVGLEFSRAYLIKSWPKRKIILGMALIALFYSFMQIPLARFTRLNTALEIVKFLGSEFLPNLAQSILATYLALLGGPLASIAYVGTLEAFEWLSPILPNPEWFLKSFVNIIVVSFGFIVLNEMASPFALMRVGMLSRSEVVRIPRGAKERSEITWIIIMMVSTVILLSPTGLLGFQLSMVASGSMRPTMDTGDMVILVDVPFEKLDVGDVVQFWREGDMIIHRVHEINDNTIVMKGDANNAPDSDLVFPNQIQGKMINVIPKIGWISIYLKSVLTRGTLIIENTLIKYAILLSTVTVGLIYSIKLMRRRYM